MIQRTYRILMICLASACCAQAQDAIQTVAGNGTGGYNGDGVPATSALAQTNPVPLISQPLVPDATAPGGPDFTLTVNGTGFVSGSVMNWNGSAHATTFVNGSQLTAAIPAADIATAGTVWVTVVNPPPGGGTSNVAFFTVTLNASGGVAFNLISSAAVGDAPRSIAMGDFNGDGKLDLATANEASNSVSVLLGDGTGHFTLASSPGTGPMPMSVTAGDFNGDGKLDLAVASYTRGNVSILLGDGKGNFTLASSPAVGAYPVSVGSGDFNGDGNLDLAVANAGNNTVSILLGDGTGNFALASSPGAGSEPYSVAVGDFNGDGNLDLAVANLGSSNTVSVLLGDGTGNFALSSSPGAGAGYSVAVGDFNGDGKLDLAVTNVFSDRVSILLGDGAGNFTLASTAATGSAPESLASGDFNGDGKLDLAVANWNSGTVSILLGDGTGNFLTEASTPAIGGSPGSVAVGDFNGDGRLGLAVANWNNGTVSILLQVPAVGLSPATLNFGSYEVGTSSSPLVATLSNGTGDSLTITDISITGANSGDYSQTHDCGTSLAAGANCAISVTFKPTAVGTRTGTLTVTDSAPNYPQTVSLTGTGTGGQAVMSLSATSLNFGDRVVRTWSSAQSIIVTNTGASPLTLTSVSHTGDYTVKTSCVSSVSPGGTCAVRVTFTPTTIGPRPGTVTLASNATNSPQTITLTGNGIGGAVLSRTTCDFGRTADGTSSVMTLNLANLQTQPLTSVAVSITGANFPAYSQTNTCGSSLDPGLKCVITVTFAPSAIGLYIATLSVTDSAANSPQTATLTGQGVPQEVVLTPTDVTFHAQEVGTTSPAVTFSLTNYLTTTVTSLAISTMGDFAVSSTTCGTALAAGAACSISVVFTPTATGTRTGRLNVNDSAPYSPQTSYLTGYGT